MHNNKIVSEDLDYITDNFRFWDRFENKVILISGAYGFLPAYIVFALHRANEKHRLNLRVIGIVRSLEKAKRKFSGLMTGNFISFAVQDVCEPVHIDTPVHYIIHAASHASPRYYGIDPVGTLMPNVIGTYNLLELARANNSESFLFLSSGEVYGEVDILPTPEDAYGSIDPTDIRSCYAESKRMAENMCVSWAKQYGVPAKIARPYHTYGPGMLLDDGRVFSDFVANIVKKTDIILKSDGLATRTFCYLADATLAFLTILTLGETGSPYNVSNEKCEVSIKDLAALLVRLYPELNLNVKQEPNANSDAYIKSKISRALPDVSRLHKLGWKAVYGLEEGFKRTVDSYL